MTTTIEPQVRTPKIPEWIEEMEFCHIYADSGMDAYCGATEVPIHAHYSGNSICESCGKPVCPRCAQLVDLENRMKQ